MASEIFQVDAFTDQPFAGNPAGVMLLAAFPTDARMQSIAAEMNAAETAFLVSRGDGFDLRWFTPTVEVDLCGHATLASAHILWETGRLELTAPAVFRTRSGELRACRVADGIEMSFPTLPVSEVTPPEGLIESLGVRPVFVGLSKFDYLVQVATAAEVRAANVRFDRLAAIDARGAILTAPSDDGRFDFISRFFAPAAGINEDPATGSAHCVLGAFWQQRLRKPTLRAYQASLRGGSLLVRVDGDTTFLTGHAVTTLRGNLLV